MVSIDTFFGMLFRDSYCSPTTLITSVCSGNIFAKPNWKVIQDYQLALIVFGWLQVGHRQIKRLMGAGCGLRRCFFAEKALKAGAKLVALDYSSAVDGCYANLRHHPNLDVVKGDIYVLPFAL